jgi:general secretion pathway protein K
MRQAQGGAAILAALLTVALVAGLSVAAFWQQWRGIEVETAERDRLQAQWLLGGALDWARERVGTDGVRSPQVDHTSEAWAQPVQDLSLQAFVAARAAAPVQPAAGGDEPRLSLQVSDAQARLNVLNLLEGQAISAQWLGVFRRLFDSLGLPPQELDTLAEQLRRANQGTLTGAGALPPEAAVPLVPTRQADLGWLGLAPATVKVLAPHVSLLPGRLPVNLNTAGAPVLQAVLGLDASQVQALLARRQAQPFANLSETGLKNTDAQLVAVNSHFFEVRMALRMRPNAPVLQVEHALLQRDGRDVRTLWQRRVLPAEESEPNKP